MVVHVIFVVCVMAPLWKETAIVVAPVGVRGRSEYHCPVMDGSTAIVFVRDEAVIDVSGA